MATPLSAVNLWIGRAGNVTKLHYDAYQNLLAQVRGQKRVYLFPPSQLSALYPYSPLSKVPHNHYFTPNYLRLLPRRLLPRNLET